MKFDLKNKKTRQDLLLGALAGFVNGFLGTGGGVVLLLPALFSPEKEDTENSFAQTAAVILAFSAVSAVIYGMSGGFSLGSSLIYCIPSVFGGILGAVLLGKLDGNALKKIFAAVLTVSGIIMILR